MSAWAVITFVAFHKVYYSISANKSKPTERADAVNRKRYTEEAEKAGEEEPDAGRDNRRSWNRGASQAESSFPGLRGSGDICTVQTSCL